jgi:N-acetylmuramoyl-L-alanine amidase
MITLKTVVEIKAFQRKHKLVVDGIAGPQTRRALAEVNRPISQSARKEPDKSAMGKTNFALTQTSLSGSVAQAERTIGAVATNAIKAAVMALPISTSRYIEEIIVHCAATPEGKKFSMRDIAAWHKERGWDGPGYHFGANLNGEIEIGRPVGQQGIHTKGKNVATVGLVYFGGVSADGKTAKDTRTPHQIVALYYLCVRLKAHHKIKKPVSGHNQYAQKACPSFSVPNDALGKI